MREDMLTMSFAVFQKSALEAVEDSILQFADASDDLAGGAGDDEGGLELSTDGEADHRPLALIWFSKFLTAQTAQHMTFSLLFWPPSADCSALMSR
jgi:hypothetical protein